MTSTSGELHICDNYLQCLCTQGSSLNSLGDILFATEVCHVHYVIYEGFKHYNFHCYMLLRGLTGEGIVVLYAVPNPFLHNKICLNQETNSLRAVHCSCNCNQQTIVKHHGEASFMFSVPTKLINGQQVLLHNWYICFSGCASICCFWGVLFSARCVRLIAIRYNCCFRVSSSCAMCDLHV